MPTAAAMTHRCEKFPRAGARDLPEQFWEETPPDHQHEADENRYLTEGERERSQQASIAGLQCVIRCVATEPERKRRQQHQHQDRHEVFDDQPTDGDAAVDGLQNAATFQRLEEHHRAGNGKSEPEHDPSGNTPAPKSSDTHAEQSGHDDLDDGAGQSDMANR